MTRPMVVGDRLWLFSQNNSHNKKFVSSTYVRAMLKTTKEIPSLTEDCKSNQITSSLPNDYYRTDVNPYIVQPNDIYSLPVSTQNTNYLHRTIQVSNQIIPYNNKQLLNESGINTCYNTRNEQSVAFNTPYQLLPCSSLTSSYHVDTYVQSADNLETLLPEQVTTSQQFLTDTCTYNN